MYKFVVGVAIFFYSVLVINSVVAKNNSSIAESQIKISNTEREFSDFITQVESLVENEKFDLAYMQLAQAYTQIKPGNNQAFLVMKWLTVINQEKNWDRVEEVFNFAHKEIETVTDQNIKFQLLHQMANSELSQGSFQPAEKLFKAALAVPKLDKILKDKAYYRLGVSQAQQGNLPDALASMQLAYQIQESTSGQPSTQVLKGLGVLNNYMK